MTTNRSRRLPGSATERPRARGTALVVGLLLTTVLAVLATHGLVGAVLELRMAAAAEYRERAFQAAEFGIAQALAAGGLATSLTLSSPRVVPDSGARPAVPGASPDAYSYQLYYDTAAGAVPFPEGSPDAGLVAYHFVVEATGTSLRGAKDTHVQGFCVVAPPGLGQLDGFERRRTSWVQLDAD